MTNKRCRSCSLFEMPDVPSDTGWCHLAPPVNERFPRVRPDVHFCSHWQSGIPTDNSHSLLCEINRRNMRINNAFIMADNAMQLYANGLREGRNEQASDLFNAIRRIRAELTL